MKLNEILNLKNSFSIFSEIILKEEFYKLNKDQLIKIISKDHISVESEMVILKSVICWVISDKANRIKSLPEIIRNVRFTLMEKEELYELLSVSLFKEDKEILDIIKKAIELLGLKSSLSESDTAYELEFDFIRPRIPLLFPKVRIFFRKILLKLNFFLKLRNIFILLN